MTSIFNEILFRPIFNLAVFFYNVIPGHDFGLAIIILTVLVRIILSPLSIKTVKSQQALNALGPKIQEIKQKHKDNPQAQSSAIMNLYKENKINPIAGCLPLFIQLPILIALYRVFIAGINQNTLNSLYTFVARPEMINNVFVGVVDLTVKNPILAVIAGGLQFLQSRQQSSGMAQGGQGKELQVFNKQLLYFFPIFIIIIGWNLPAGLILYWITTTVFSIFEQIYIKRTHGLPGKN